MPTVTMAAQMAAQMAALPGTSPAPVSPGAVFGCQQSGAAPGEEPLMPAVQP